MIRDAGHDVTNMSCDDARCEAAALTPAACDLIAISGGDGTAGRLLKQLRDCSVPITLLPTGTANNISRSFGLADRSLDQLIAGWPRASIHPIDIGELTGPTGTELFVEAVGLGLFTRTMLEIDAFDSLAHLTTPEDKIAEALAILGEHLRTFPARPMSLRLDGRDLSGDYLMLEAMNIRFVGPNLYVAPSCDPGDGLLDVVLVAERDRKSLLAHLASWRRGVLLAPALPTYRGAHLELEWRGHPLHVDDAAWPGDRDHPVPSRLDIRARKHALRLLVPARD